MFCLYFWSLIQSTELCQQQCTLEIYNIKRDETLAGKMKGDKGMGDKMIGRKIMGDKELGDKTMGDDLKTSCEGSVGLEAGGPPIARSWQMPIACPRHGGWLDMIAQEYEALRSECADCHLYVLCNLYKNVCIHICIYGNPPEPTFLHFHSHPFNLACTLSTWKPLVSCPSRHKKKNTKAKHKKTQYLETLWGRPLREKAENIEESQKSIKKKLFGEGPLENIQKHNTIDRLFGKFLLEKIQKTSKKMTDPMDNLKCKKTKNPKQQKTHKMTDPIEAPTAPRPVHGVCHFVFCFSIVFALALWATTSKNKKNKMTDPIEA